MTVDRIDPIYSDVNPQIPDDKSEHITGYVSERDMSSMKASNYEVEEMTTPDAMPEPVYAVLDKSKKKPKPAETFTFSEFNEPDGYSFSYGEMFNY